MAARQVFLEIYINWVKTATFSRLVRGVDRHEEVFKMRSVSEFDRE